MATVHPSRMGLVPMDRTERNGSSSYDNVGDSSRIKSHDRARYDDRNDDRGRRNRSRSTDRRRNGYDAERRRSRGHSAEKPLSRERTNGRGHNNNENGRRSPEYGDYKRPPSPREENGQPPWRAKENMYPPRNEARGRQNGYGTGGNDFFEARRQQRANSTFNIWPPSPKQPVRDLSPIRDTKSHKHSKRRRSPSVSSVDSSEEDRRRRKERKERERRKEREKEVKESRHRRRHRSRRSDEDSDEPYSRERRSRSRRTSSRHRSHISPPPRSDEDMWQEKSKDELTATAQPAPAPTNDLPMGGAFMSSSRPTQMSPVDDDDDEEVGPKPAFKVTTTSKRIDERAYGGALLRGEGSAMAAFLQEGGTEARIPRRGEIGLTSDEIASFESVGYVMSGSRHKRMNAVRMRKENQVISAEEKRGILKLQKEERERREAILQDEFRELVEENLKGAKGRPVTVAAE